MSDGAKEATSATTPTPPRSSLRQGGNGRARPAKTRNGEAGSRVVKGMRWLHVVFVVRLLGQATPDGGAIMTETAENMDKALDARRQYIYQQKVRASLVRSNGHMARREKREYDVTPAPGATEKKLVRLEGEYFKGKETIRYSQLGFKHKGMDIDGELMEELIDELVSARKSRDGIPKSLFPLSVAKLPNYKFTFHETQALRGRPAHHITFEPARKETCVVIGGDDDECAAPWKGDAWIDAEDLQPVQMQTQLAFAIPRAVRVLLGTNLRQTGFAVSYRRLAPGVWFPVSYGAEFRIDVLFGYKRTITLSMENSDFRRTNAESKIQFHPE